MIQRQTDRENVDAAVKHNTGGGKGRRLTTALVDAVFGVLWAAAAFLTVTILLPESAVPGAATSESAESEGTEALPLAVPVEQRLSFEDDEVEALGREALTNIDYPWVEALPGWAIEFKRGNTDIAGYTWSREQRIEVFIRPGDTATTVARVLAHELGHAVDVAHNDGDERRQWLAQRGADDDSPWWPHSGAADFETGAGDFAEVFAAWQVGTDDFRSRLAGPPTTDDLQLISRLSDG